MTYTVTLYVTKQLQRIYKDNGKYMKLEEWRSLKKFSYKQLANKFGVAHPTIVRRWCLSKSHKDCQIPNHNYMKIIVQMTDGAVQPNDFYELHE